MSLMYAPPSYVSQRWIYSHNYVFLQNQENVLKLTDLISATVDNINQQCDCSFSQDGVVDGEFRCFELNADDVTFRAALRGLAQVSSSVLAGYVQQWVASGATVVIQNVRLPLDSNCRDAVIIDSREELECAPAASGTSQGLNTGAAAGISAASVLVAVVIVAIIVLLIVFVCRRRRAHVTLTNLKKVMRFVCVCVCVCVSLCVCLQRHCNHTLHCMMS